ncbi:MAG: hypothetical protein PHS14_19960 [Elusimicrobia bacterium]|nr:hypothetical protein [Elusimicrobiota bacterium]
MKLALAFVLLAGAVRAEHIAGGGSGTVSIANGDLIYAAMPAAGGINGQVLVRRLSADGGVFWEQRWGRGRAEEPTAIATTPDGGVVVSGASKSGCFVVRFDGQGRFVWEISPLSGLCRPAGVVTDGEGEVYLLATIDGSEGYDAMIWKFSRLGDVGWTHRHHSNEPLYAQNLYLDPRGDRLRAFVLRKRGTDFIEDFFLLDLAGRLL